jgi:hypothetical protein
MILIRIIARLTFFLVIDVTSLKARKGFDNQGVTEFEREISPNDYTRIIL